MINEITDARETSRLAALTSLKIMDTARESCFDRIVFMAAQVFRTPIAAVSLVDDTRQWFKAKVGLRINETARNLSFCAHALNATEPLIINDATADARFRSNPLVTGEPHIRFYAGVPITGPGNVVVGTLCVIDTIVRTVRPNEIAALKELAKETSTLLMSRLVRSGAGQDWIAGHTSEFMPSP